MDTRILSIALVACAMGSTNGNEYPAGVDPQSCPNYPNCDNAALHGRSAATIRNPWNSVAAIPAAATNSWDSTNRWNAPAESPSAVATRYPAGVNPQSCPSYPNCDNVALHGGVFTSRVTPSSWESLGSDSATVWNAASNGHSPASGAAPQYPAGVNAQSCPNYPYCF